MEITEVRVHLAESYNGKLKAYASVGFDGVFAVRDLRVILGFNGNLFLSMPARKITDRCPFCKCPNPVRACFCNRCGAELDPMRDDRDKPFEDLCFPTNTEFRRKLTDAVLQEYERMKAGQDCVYGVEIPETLFVAFSDEVSDGCPYRLSDVQDSNGKNGQAPASG